MKQILIRTGEITKASLIEEYSGEDKIPDVFNPELLTPIHPDAVSWYDETHKDCCVSKLGGKVKRQFLFKRDAEGNYDPDGEYGDPSTEQTFKYNAQARFSLGCALKVDDSGCNVGYRMPLFDYSKLRMKSKTEYDGLDEQAIDHAKKNGGREWKYDGREKGVIYRADPPSILDEIGKEKEQALFHVGLKTLADIRALDGDKIQIKDVLERMPKTTGKRPQRVVGEKGLKTFISKCVELDLLDEDPPAVTDYTLAEKPI